MGLNANHSNFTYPQLLKNNLRVPYLPAEIRQMIINRLSPVTLANTIRAGLPVRQEDFDRGQHAYAWSSILKNSDFTSASHHTRSKGNFFLIGYGLQDLYDSFEKRGSALSEIHLLMTWHTTHIWLSDKRPHFGEYIPFTDPEYPDITLNAKRKTVWNQIRVPELSKYIRKDSSEKLQTNVLYLHDDEWKLHAVDVTPYHGGYAIQLENMRESWGNTMTLELFERYPSL